MAKLSYRTIFTSDAHLGLRAARADTFGLVMPEAMASGAPVASYPVEGPLDVIKNSINGWMDEDLQLAAMKALDVERESCREYAEGYSRETGTKQFLSLIEPHRVHPASITE